MAGKIQFLTDKELNIIRGKASVGKATIGEIQKVFKHIDYLQTS